MATVYSHFPGVLPEVIDQYYPDYPWFYAISSISVYEYQQENLPALPAWQFGSIQNMRLMRINIQYISQFNSPSFTIDSKVDVDNNEFEGDETNVGVHTFLKTLGVLLQDILQHIIPEYEGEVGYLSGRYICKAIVSNVGNSMITRHIVRGPYGKWNLEVPPIRYWNNNFAIHFYENAVASMMNEYNSIASGFEDYEEGMSSLSSIEFAFLYSSPLNIAPNQAPMIQLGDAQPPQNLPPPLPARSSIFLQNLLAAGCSDRKLRNPRVISPFPKNSSMPNREVVEVPSQNNNCVFACLRHGLKCLQGEANVHIKQLYSKLRKALNLSSTELVPLIRCQTLSTIFQCSIQLYNENDESFAFFLPDNGVPTDHVELKIENQHAYLIRKRNMLECSNCHAFFAPKGMTAHQKKCLNLDQLLICKCIDCGREVKIQKTPILHQISDVDYEIIQQNHTCNASRTSFYQRHILEKSNEYVKPLTIPRNAEPIRNLDFTDKSFLKQGLLQNDQEKEVRWRYIAEDRLYCFDIETFPNSNDSSAFTPYAVGTYFSERTPQYKCFFGEYCMDEFVDDLVSCKATYGMRTILAFNGRGFDFHFLLRALYRKGLKAKNIILKNSNISRFEFEGTNTFDLNAFFPTSLSNLCKEFQVHQQFQKASFPHDFLNSFERIHYIGPLPDKHYWPNENSPCFSERVQYFGSEEVANRIWPSSDCWNCYEHCSFYLEKDVLGLVQVYSIFGRQVYELLNVSINKYISAPQLAYDMFRTTCTKFLLPIPQDESVQNFYQRAVYGGRVYPRKAFYQSSCYPLYLQLSDEKNQGLNLWDDAFTEFDNRLEEMYMDICLNDSDHDHAQLMNEYETMSNDYLYDLDVVSLYPTAMLKLFPCGCSYALSPTDLSNLTSIAISSPAKLLSLWNPATIPDRELDVDTYHPLIFGHGIFCIDAIPNPSLLEPTLPRREQISAAHSSIVWDLGPIEMQVYTSIDIFRALRDGYKITKFHSGIVFAGMAPVLRQHILKAKAFKEEGDANPKEKAAIRSFGKLILNATYGKFLQRPVYEEVKIGDLPSISKTIMSDKYAWDDLCIFDDVKNLFVVSAEKMNLEDRVKQLGKPTYLGAFVLSYSRLIMDEIYHIADPCKNCVENLPYYGDTDSLIMPKKCFDRLKLAGKVNDTGPKIFGNVSNDIGNDVRIIKAFFVSPKVYAVEYFTKEGKIGHHMRAKGIPSSKMKFDMYELLHNQKERYYSENVPPNPSIVQVNFRSFLRTGLSERARFFKAKDLVAKPPVTDDIDNCSQSTVEIDYEEESETEGVIHSPVRKSYPSSTFMREERTILKPCSVLYVNVSRSLSGRIWTGRDYNFENNFSTPIGYCGVPCQSCNQTD